MIKQFLVLFVLASGLFSLVACEHNPMQGKQNIQFLVKGGAGMDNFRTLGDTKWQAQSDAIVAESGGEGFLVTRKSYGDFHMIVEFWADHTTNSGIFLRLSDPDVVNSDNGYEVNIFDQRPDPLYGSGAIVDVGKVDPMPKVGGKWNTYDITARGTHLVVRLNGEETVNAHDSKHAEGPIAFQFGGVPNGEPGAIKWRKITVQSL